MRKITDLIEDLQRLDPDTWTNIRAAYIEHSNGRPLLRFRLDHEKDPELRLKQDRQKFESVNHDND